MSIGRCYWNIFPWFWNVNSCLISLSSSLSDKAVWLHDSSLLATDRVLYALSLALNLFVTGSFPTLVRILFVAFGAPLFISYFHCKFQGFFWLEKVWTRYRSFFVVRSFSWADASCVLQSRCCICNCPFWPPFLFWVNNICHLPFAVRYATKHFCQRE